MLNNHALNGKYTQSKVRNQTFAIVHFLWHFIQIDYESKTEPVQNLVTDTACEMLGEVCLMSMPQVSQPREQLNDSSDMSLTY